VFIGDLLFAFKKTALFEFHSLIKNHKIIKLIATLFLLFMTTTPKIYI